MTPYEKILKFLDGLEALESKATKCSVCCSSVIHHSSNEGTQYYESISEKRMKPMINMIRVLVKACNHFGDDDNYARFSIRVLGGMPACQALEQAAKEVPG